MRITRLADYAAIIILDLKKQGHTKNAKNVAESTNLPFSVVSKLLAQLSTAGLVEGQRGRGHGYKIRDINRPITVLDIVEAIEGPIVVATCAAEDERCEYDASCTLKGGWHGVNNALRETLGKISLSSLAPICKTGA